MGGAREAGVSDDEQWELIVFLTGLGLGIFIATVIFGVLRLR